MGSTMKQRNGTIDFLKFVFAVIVIIFHGSGYFTDDASMQIFKSGRLGVEFFFLVSGYMMAVSAEKTIGQKWSGGGQKVNNIGCSTYCFIKNKIKRLLPEIWVAWVISFAAYHVVEKNYGLFDILCDFVKAIPELLLIEQSGIMWKSYNGVTWYISAMIFVMIILYPLILKYRDTFYYIFAPVIFCFLLGFLFQTFGKLTKPAVYSSIAFRGFIRGFAEIAGGCICYKVSCKLKTYNYTKGMKILFGVIEWGLYFASIVYMFFHAASKYDFIIVLFLAVSITITLSQSSYDDKVFNRPIFFWLGKYSFSLYLGHAFWRKLINLLFPAWGYYKKLGIYMLISFITALFIMYVSKWLRKMWAALSPTVKKYIIRES